MKIETVIKLVIWLIAFNALMTLGLEMFSAPSTIENIIGLLVVVATVYLSVKTRFLTAIKFKRNDRR